MTFAALSARAKQQWLFVELCMREPLMITPLGSDVDPHFKLPKAQGWALRRYCMRMRLGGLGRQRPNT